VLRKALELDPGHREKIQTAIDALSAQEEPAPAAPAAQTAPRPEPLAPPAAAPREESAAPPGAKTPAAPGAKPAAPTPERSTGQEESQFIQ